MAGKKHHFREPSLLRIVVRWRLQSAYLTGRKVILKVRTIPFVTTAETLKALAPAWLLGGRQGVGINQRGPSTKTSCHSGSHAEE